MESSRPALQIFTFLFLATVVASQADLDGYWKSKLPNSRMPKAVRDLLHNEWSEDKSAAVGVGKGGVNVHTGKGTNVNVGHGGVGVNTHGKKGGTNVGVGKGGVNVHAHHKGRPVYVGVNPGPNPFMYHYAASEDQLRSDPSVALFFLHKDLHSGKTMTLHFTTSPRTSGFLPRKAADSIPFSSEALNSVLSRFELEPSSAEARAMKTTVEECEKEAVRGEDKYCATSLESMVEFSTSKLGKNVDAVSTEVQNQKGAKLSQAYKIVGVKKINGGDDEAVVCHRQKYAYAVFYCHGTKATEAYAVYLAGADGTKAKAAAICHKDTAAWNPKHLAFQVLKVRPGTVPICHFLPEDHIVWVAK